MSMNHNTILVADHEALNCTNLAVLLRNQGYTVLQAGSPTEAIQTATQKKPHLILSNTQFGGECGFEFCSKLRQDTQLRKIPFVFLSRDTSNASRVQAIETGATDYLIRPAYVSDILARIERFIGDYKRRMENPAPRTEFQGQLDEIHLSDLILTIQEKEESGLIKLHQDDESGTLYFANGHIADAELGKISGSKALYRLLSWETAQFHVQIGPMNRTNRFKRTNAALVSEAAEERTMWECLRTHLPPLHSVSIQTTRDPSQAYLPPNANSVLKLFDDQRTLQEILNHSHLSDRATLDLMCELHVQGIVVSRQPVQKPVIKPFAPPQAPKEMVLKATDFEADSPPIPTRRKTNRRRFSIRAFNPWQRKDDATNDVSLDNLAQEIQLLKQAESQRKNWLGILALLGLLGAGLAIALTKLA